MTFAKRALEITITLGSGQYGDVLGASKTMSNHRATVEIQTAGGTQQGSLYAQIYGLPLSDMNQLTQIGPYSNIVRTGNTISIAAGNDGNALTQIYQGTIKNAVGNYTHPPEPFLEVWALSAAGAAVVPVGANSWLGPTSVDSIMQALAAQVTPTPLTYSNNGVTAQLSNPYLTGTVLMQIQQCAKAAGINYKIENGMLSVWPKGSNVLQPVIPVISAQNGMVGYPNCTANGLEITTEFNPNITVGGLVTVQSQIQIANGNWTVVEVHQNLQTETPGGQWFTQFRGVHPDGNT